MLSVHCQQGEGAFELLGGELHGTGQIAFSCTAVDRTKQSSSHFGVGVRKECDTVLYQLGLELGKVFNDAIVNQGEVV